jgi:hypothetical protein
MILEWEKLRFLASQPTMIGLRVTDNILFSDWLIYLGREFSHSCHHSVALSYACLAQVFKCYLPAKLCMYWSYLFLTGPARSCSYFPVHR